MGSQSRTRDINQEIEREFVRLLTEAEASHRPAEVELAGRRYQLVPVDEIRTTEDPFKDYDPERARAAVAAAAGALEGLDVDAFLEHISVSPWRGAAQEFAPSSRSRAKTREDERLTS